MIHKWKGLQEFSIMRNEKKMILLGKKRLTECFCSCFVNNF